MSETWGRDVIAGVAGHPMSGLWVLGFEHGPAAFIESGYGVRNLAACFGATEGAGDLIEKIVGQEVYFGIGDGGLLEWFIPAADWDGLELEVGERKAWTHPYDEDCCCDECEARW